MTRPRGSGLRAADAVRPRVGRCPGIAGTGVQVMSKRTRNPARRAVVEAVESRTLMSFTPAADAAVVNAYTAGTQIANANGNALATDSQGNYVATWTSVGQDGSQGGIYA